MKNRKYVVRFLVYAVVALVIGYVIYVIVDMARSSQGVFRPARTHLSQNNEKEENYVRPDPGKNVQDKEFKKKTEKVRVKTLAVYTAPYSEIELFKQDKLFRDEYAESTVFVFATENGKDLAENLTSISLFRGESALTPAFRIFELGDDDALIVAVADNNKVKMFRDGMKIRLNFTDSLGGKYTKQQSLKMSDYKYKKGEIHGGDIFRLGENGFCLRVSDGTESDAVVRDDVEFASMHYEFSSSFLILNFGKNGTIDPDMFKFSYPKPEAGLDFDSVRFEVVAQKEHANNEDLLEKGNHVLCLKRVTVIGNLKFEKNLSDNILAMYKEAMNGGTVMFGQVSLPLRHIVESETSRSVRKDY